MAQEKHFGERVHAAALAAGMETPAQIAKACKVSRRTAEKWLKQREPRVSAAHLFSLSAALGVRMRWLYTGEGVAGWRLQAREADLEAAVTILEGLPAGRTREWLAIGRRMAAK